MTHVYRMNPGQHVVGIVVLAIGLVGIVGIWTGVIMGTREPSVFEMMIPVIIAVGAALFTIRAFHNSVCLSDAALVVRGLSGTRVLPLDKIEGRRKYLDKGDEHSPSVWHLVVESNDDRFPKLDIEEIYRFDDFFYRWFDALPDLDEADKHRPKPSNFRLI